MIDPDLVEAGNLDRLIHADRHCLGLPKANVAAAPLRRIATARRTVVRPVPLSIRTERACRHAADADLIVCCVDNAGAREVPDHPACANYLPLTDGGGSRGVARPSPLRQMARPPGRPRHACLRCRGQYASGDARDERMGIRRHGRYIIDDTPDGPEPGPSTFAFCNLVAAEADARLRLLGRVRRAGHRPGRAARARGTRPDLPVRGPPRGFAGSAAHETDGVRSPDRLGMEVRVTTLARTVASDSRWCPERASHGATLA